MPRKSIVGGVVLASMTLAGLPLAAVATATPAEAATALSCNGSTIYDIERGSSATADGTLLGLTSSTVGGSSVTATAISSIPSGGNANALGITKGGTGAYMVDQNTTSANSANIHYYDASAGKWSTFTGSSGSNDSFVAGAVDPANGVYYYASYFAGTSSTSAYANVYGFDTNNNTAISGVIGKVDLGTGNSTAGQNGDLAFDGSGNMYLLSSDGTNVAINVVPAASIPKTGAGATLTSKLLSSFTSSAKYNGIAFDNTGALYVQDLNTSNVSEVTKLDPVTGKVLAGPTALSSNAQTYADVDLGACSVNPTLQLQANVVGRFTSTDEFGLSVTGGGISSGNTATTTGTATGIQSAVAGPVIASSPNTYTLTETAANGADLSNYTITYSCVDTANGNSVVASGSGATISLPFPATTGTSPAITCTFTNTPVAATPGISVVKSASPTSFNKVGQTITYSFAVKNTGNVSLSNVKVNDTDLPGLSATSCPSTTLAAKASQTCTATYSTTQADLDNGSVTNSPPRPAPRPGRPRR